MGNSCPSLSKPLKRAFSVRRGPHPSRKCLKTLSGPDRSAGPKKGPKGDKDRFEQRLEHAKTAFKSKAAMPYPTEKLGNFIVVGSLAESETARIFLVKHKKEHSVHALKAIPKRNNDPEMIVRYHHERDLLWAMSNRFIIRFHFDVQESRNFCIVMDYAEYGTFSRLRGRQLTEPLVKRGAAQVVLALEYLHACGILYRDLKAANIFIVKDFYLKLGAFGRAKRLSSNRTYSLMGTISNMPPEVLARQDYGKEIDWWSLGIFLYESVFRQHPFCLPEWFDAQKVDAIMNVDLRFPVVNDANAALRRLISGLLNKRRDHRIGTLAGGVTDIMQHEWFSDISFVNIYNRREPMMTGLELEPLEPLPASAI